MKSHLKYLEVTKGSVVKEMTIRTKIVFKYLEEREKEAIKKKMKSIENSEKIERTESQSKLEAQKNKMIGKIEDFEKKRQEENEKLNDLSKNVIV